MSRTDVIHPIMAALIGAEEFLGKGRTWQPRNDQQRIFLQRFIENGGDLARIPEMKTKASWKAEEIMAFLKENGFTVTLNSFKDDEFGVASLMRMLVEWLQPGRAGTLTSSFDGKTYPSVGLREGAGLSFHSLTLADGVPAAFVRIPTKSGDSICMLPLGNRPMARVDLVRVAQDVVDSSEPCDDYEGVIFPMVDLDETRSLDWLAGMKTVTTGGNEAKVREATQQTRLKMNQFGAKMESAVVIKIGITSVRFPKPVFRVDEPFLFWAERAGLALPYFTAYVTPEDWKDPGDLGSV